MYQGKDVPESPGSPRRLSHPRHTLLPTMQVIPSELVTREAPSPAPFDDDGLGFVLEHLDPVPRDSTSLLVVLMSGLSSGNRRVKA